MILNKSSIYPSLDIEITLRCNGGCSNCIKLCNTKDATGLDYENLDMTLYQIEEFVSQVENLGKKTNRPVFEVVYITGGEPTLHPDLSEIVKVVTSRLCYRYIKKLYINSNLINQIPKDLERYIINFGQMNKKPIIHNTVLVHPDDLGQSRPTFLSCTHYRKRTIVLGYHGYNICCAADGYIRLFGKEHLFVSKLPDNYTMFPLEKMNEVCQHCPFGCEVMLFEKDVGRPVSEIYKEQAELNRTRHRISSIF